MKPILLVPMAGKGQRFIDEGFKIPKQFIKVGNHTMIEWSFKSFDWEDCEVIFIVRRDQINNFKHFGDNAAWPSRSADTELKKMFGDQIKIVVAEDETDGTVSSCLLAKQYINKDVPIGITTLDVFFQPFFNLNKVDLSLDGCLLTVETNNPAYSYSQLDENGLVIKTAEKEVISTHGNVGYYCFSRGSDFVKYGEAMISKNIRSKNEFYVAPLYNLLIQDGLKINTHQITNKYHMGTPHELQEFMDNDFKKLNNEIW